MAASGLGGVHEAMRAGRLDGYAASVIGEELEEAPAEVARAVVRAVEEQFGRECASQLRRRCRRALVRISPDLLRQRAQQAREEAGLRRWAEAPGVDRWSGTFPSEQAAMGWAAVDALARRYVKDGVCERLEQARGKALMDLVTGNATIDVTVVFTTVRGRRPRCRTRRLTAGCRSRRWRPGCGCEHPHRHRPRGDWTVQERRAGGVRWPSSTCSRPRRPSRDSGQHWMRTWWRRTGRSRGIRCWCGVPGWSGSCAGHPG